MAKIRGIKPEIWTDIDFVELEPFARLLWLGMWNFACDNGHLPDKPKQIKMRVLPTDDVSGAALLDELEANGQIERAGGWITIPNFAHHQKPNKAYWTTCEKAGCARPTGTSQPKTQGAKRGTSLHNGEQGSAPCDGEGDGEGDGEVMGKEIHPRGSAPSAPPRDDVTRICNHLADRIEANTGKRPTIGKTWHDAARLMLDRDDIPETDVHAAIDWASADEFWRANILSLPKLREKYTTLSLQAQRGGRSSRQQQTDDIFDRAAARLGVNQT